jgi:hypothetical protein
VNSTLTHTLHRRCLPASAVQHSLLNSPPPVDTLGRSCQLHPAPSAHSLSPAAEPFGGLPALVPALPDAASATLLPPEGVTQRLQPHPVHVASSQNETLYCRLIAHASYASRTILCIERRKDAAGVPLVHAAAGATGACSRK